MKLCLAFETVFANYAGVVCLQRNSVDTLSHNGHVVASDVDSVPRLKKEASLRRRANSESFAGSQGMRSGTTMGQHLRLS